MQCEHACDEKATFRVGDETVRGGGMADVDVDERIVATKAAKGNSHLRVELLAVGLGLEHVRADKDVQRICDRRDILKGLPWLIWALWQCRSRCDPQFVGLGLHCLRRGCLFGLLESVLGVGHWYWGTSRATMWDVRNVECGTGS